MKKLLFFLSIIVFIWASTFYTISSTTATVSDEFADAVFPWLMENNLTKFTNTDDFRPTDSITRAEASKFVSNYAGLLWIEKEDSHCDFYDIVGFDTTLIPYIQDACEYGLFRGNNGNFLPRNSITEAEALVVIVRSLEGMMDESGSPWYGAYYDRAYELSIIGDADGIGSMSTTRITREKLGTWLHRAYNSDALEDTIVYETDVDGPSDCSSYEKYDARKKVCSYECIDEAECDSIQADIDKELGTWVDELDGATRDEPKSEWKPVVWSTALYRVSRGEKISLISGKDTPEWQSFWNEVAELSPDSLSDTYIDSFELYSDASSDVIAYVDDEEWDGKWKVAINLPIHTSSDTKEQKATLIHELSHIITLNKDQFTNPSGACPSYETDEWCTKSASYMNSFVKKFWGTNKTATYSESKFVSEYASSSPEEDIAESFAFYVLEANHSDASTREQKMNFFNSYPEVIKIRSDMRNVLASDIIRAKKWK